ncbi:hypothetical protein APA_1758 [Pseudanabaena sp. lw0831]|uniref:DUF1830 domain-containing protein n=1 Tax=Pseudanabaena sp. lw0831 TaxID=1357935 RepID=UPI001914EA9D|nr:DUF1830 domain-containing protein [Pseudanabaena sp. lw0831]GBO53810.1 hypothetical protein APA_1758 [Pseudanabaena sp. lw0831]
MFNIQSRKINPDNLENQLNQITCIYRNESEIMQIIRISQTNVAFFERVVLPNQCIQFSTSADAFLEVCEGVISGSIQSDTIPCYQLAIATDLNMKQNIAIAKELHRNSQDAFAVAA